MRGLRHRDLLLSVLLCCLGWPAFALADGGPASSQPPPPLRAARLGGVIRVTPTYQSPAWSHARPLDLSSAAQRPGALQLGTIGSFLNGRLRGESALSYTEPDGGSVDQSRGTQHQAVRLGLTGIEGRMHYGLTYRSAGDAALTENGLESREAWVGWRSSFLAVRSSILQRSNHPAQDPSRSRVTALQKRLALDLTLPAWPALTIAYTQGLSSHSFESVRSNPTRTHTDSFETSLNYALSRL